MRIVENAVGFAEIDARKRQVEIELSVPENIPDVMADPILIEQVLLNLLKNGIEAMEKSEHRSLRLVITDQGAIVELAVIDRGHGLKDPDRLFEPFYSTKSEGLGMGLNICRTIIESHHGRLWASANPEGGTIFRFTLPCATPAQRPAEDTQELHA
jgi:signal transduction histidine kinase